MPFGRGKLRARNLFLEILNVSVGKRGNWKRHLIDPIHEGINLGSNALFRLLLMKEIN